MTLHNEEGGAVYYYGLDTDPNGNIYLFGELGGVVDLQPGPGEDLRSSLGRYDVFVSRLNSDGTYGWSVTFGGEGTYNNEEAGRAIVFGTSKVFVAGMFKKPTDFDTGPGVDMRTPVGLQNAFVLSLSSAGEFQGVITFGEGPQYTEPLDLAVDGQENMFITGYFAGPADFDPGPGEEIHFSNLNTPDIFITRFNADGTHAWTRTIGGREWDSGYQIEVDQESNVYAAGEFRGTVDFDPGPAVDSFTASDGIAFFLTKYDAGGNYLWTRVWQTRITRQFLTRSPQGALYLTGTTGFSGPIDFDPTNGEDWRFGQNDAFVTSISDEGAYRWTQVFVSEGEGAVIGEGIITDQHGDVLVTGIFGLMVDFDPGPGVEEYTTGMPPGYQNIFVVKLAGDGAYRWTRVLGTPHSSVPLLAAGGDEIILAGWTLEYSDLDPGCVQSVRGPATDYGENFVLKLACNQPCADYNHDGRVDLLDAASFQNCATGPAPVVCNANCPLFDFDSDDDIDLTDWAAFLGFFVKP